MTSAVHLPSREQLIYWLHEASEIEHHLMCCYLYAAFSLKWDDPHWSEAQREAVKRWRATIMSVVFEEMTHLALVGNLANALGSTPHVNRPALPVDAGPYPAGFVIRLAAFSAETIEHFKFLERSSNQAQSDGAGFEPTRQYRRAIPESRLSPGPRDYATVGELYEVLAHSLEACVAAQGESAVFIGDPALQIDASLAPLPGMVAVTDLDSARRAITTIVTQGEGAGSEEIDSHFSRFSRIADELAALTAADPSFAPAWPAATNPVMNAPVHSASERVYISEPRIARWLDIGNAMYTTSLRCLLQGFATRERRAKATWLTASFSLMRALVPVGQGLAARPAGDDANGPHAGLTFTPLRALTRLPESDAARFVAERMGQLRQRAIELPVHPVDGERCEMWPGVIDLLAAQQAALLELAGIESATPQQATPVNVPAPSPTPAAPAESKIETAKGRDVTVIFEGRRCIHSRHCVLDAPSVFKANTPGEWIYPDTVSTEALIAVAHSCPSGAIRYERHDGAAEEAAPAVNQLRIRENGPYALHAPLTLAGNNDGFRATLCRCGQSNNKPWCDGTHATAGFVASGEPKSSSVDPLAVRDGPLEVAPQKNGPLHVRGNLEICAGTGRTVARVTEAKLCRCGQSKNKPFCDLSHLAAGFVADGA
ncbi:ferritin-like domain-containing protein [Dyella subtropica]|uniref:ferritin-like domain-containing protein n=1 Tax=Dyella subtropica TaxID=2992127 RepID=UPI0022595179|nr:ferritin-like domain-containing protein [Dyella subtropica]